jgi:hypothetical protein
MFGQGINFGTLAVVAEPYAAEYLVVAGGAGGGTAVGGAANGAGGGAGGLRTSYGATSGGGASAESSITLEPSTVYTITVGAGGVGHIGNNAVGGQGSDSVFSTITSLGGGGGGGNTTEAASGGSGGGGKESDGVGAAGTANQGYAGGNGSEVLNRGGGGGGASSAGSGGTPGAGLASTIAVSSVTYATGGEGVAGQTSPGGSAASNTGNGGRSGGNSSEAGGSGIVILRVLTADYSGTTSGSPTVTTSGSDTIMKFTGSGTYTA